jgi:NAD(P)-dependent dehydrogenase (short-subunit alcohol dehydrogenase family)
MALNILITGCSSGFGRLMSETLARRGHHVFAGMRDVAGRNASAAESIKAAAGDAGGSITPVEIDITSDASVEAGVGSVLKATDGRIDVAINNAAVATFGLVEAFTAEQVAKVFDTNVGGIQRVCRAVLPGMRARGEGLLIHVGSSIGRVVVPTMGLYCATKFAVEALADAYRFELAPLGVESILIQPGTHPTNIIGSAVQPTDAERVASYGPLAGLAGQLGAAFEGMLSGPNAPNSQAVADVVAGLIEMPYGERPARTVVDAQPDGTLAINAVCDQIQAGLLGAIGLGGFLKVTRREPAA